MSQDLSSSSSTSSSAAAVEGARNGRSFLSSSSFYSSSLLVVLLLLLLYFLVYFIWISSVSSLSLFLFLFFFYSYFIFIFLLCFPSSCFFSYCHCGSTLTWGNKLDKQEVMNLNSFLLLSLWRWEEDVALSLAPRRQLRLVASWSLTSFSLYFSLFPSRSLFFAVFLCLQRYENVVVDRRRWWKTSWAWTPLWPDGRASSLFISLPQSLFSFSQLLSHFASQSQPCAASSIRLLLIHLSQKECCSMVKNIF